MARTEISTLGEFGLIKHLTKDIEVKNESTVKGVGDDCAILDYGKKLTLVTTDLLLVMEPATGSPRFSATLNSSNQRLTEISTLL